MKRLATLILALVPSFSRAQSAVPEGGDITPLSDGIIVYGTPTAWAPARTVKSGLTYVCDNATFGPDPAPGKGKTCTFMPGQPPLFRPACVTSTIGGTGGVWRYSVSVGLSGIEMWGGWLCPKADPALFVCRNLGCAPGAPVLPATGPSIADLVARAKAAVQAAK